MQFKQFISFKSIDVLNIMNKKKSDRLLYPKTYPALYSSIYAFFLEILKYRMQIVLFNK